jgi:hypothetical protein
MSDSEKEPETTSAPDKKIIGIILLTNRSETFISEEKFLL